MAWRTTATALPTDPEQVAELARLLVVRSAPDPTTGCTMWTGKLETKDGYGRLVRFAQCWATHRLSWALTHGRWPYPGEQVRHTCDTPPCINPAHLLIGTNADNVRDAIERDRYPKGEDHHQARLTEFDVREIRRRYAESEVSMEALAREFGIGHSAVHRIIRHLSWRHVA